MSEFAYWIDPAESKKNGLLTIRLGQIERINSVLKPLAKPSSFTLTLLRQAKNPTDVEAIHFLIKEELQFQKGVTGRSPHTESLSFQWMHVEQGQSIQALKLLAATQKLFFEQKHLVADFFAKVEFYYQVERLDSNRVKVSGHLKWRDQTTPLTDCEWVGPGKPHWFIKGVSLRTISTHVNWKALKYAYEHPHWILEGPQIASFLEEFEEDDLDTPQIVVIGGSKEDLYQSTAPLPILVLKDRVGAFADLWMDYGQGYRIAFHDPHKELKDQSGKQTIKRQLEAEKSWEKDLLETDFIKKEVSQSHYYCPVDKVAKSLTFLLEIGWHIQDWKNNQVMREKSVQLFTDQTNQSLLVKGHMRYENHEVDVSDVLGAFNRRERFVQIAPGKVGLLPHRWEKSPLQELAEEGEIIGKEIRVKRSHLGAVPSLLNQSALSSPLNDLKDKLNDFKQIAPAKAGEDFKGQLRPYQQQGLNWLSFLADYEFHGILADDMGLGKTIQVLALLSRLPQDLPHLIIVPTSLLFNWKREIEKFLPSRTPYIHQGPERATTPPTLTEQSIILTSYTTMRLDILLLQKILYGSIILDEAQTIKNAHTQTAQAIFTLQARLRLSITGTPIENHLNELWSHFRFLIPDLLGNEESFNGDIQAAYADPRYLQRIKRKIAPFILRRKKEEVAKDLPERIDQVAWIEMNEDQRTLYDRFLAGVRGNLLKKVEAEGIGKHRLEILEVLLRLRQICCHPLLVESIRQETEGSSSAKLDALQEDLATAIDEGRKVLVYSQFTSMLKVMTKMAQEQRWPYSYLDGSTVDREKAVNLFQENPQVPLFFISLKAGGVGLNLTAADYVFLYDPWWNEAVEEQAINRAHRIGRQDTVIAKRFIIVESIEEKMMKLKASKRLIMDSILDSEINPESLSIEDLSYLLS